MRVIAIPTVEGVIEVEFSPAVFVVSDEQDGLTEGFCRHFDSVIAVVFARTSISGDNAWAGCPSGGQRDLELDATAEETMSPIARRPMPSSLPPAA
jgi:hypothetical protein